MYWEWKKKKKKKKKKKRKGKTIENQEIIGSLGIVNWLLLHIMKLVGSTFKQGNIQLNGSNIHTLTVSD